MTRKILLKERIFILSPPSSFLWMARVLLTLDNERLRVWLNSILQSLMPNCRQFHLQMAFSCHLQSFQVSNKVVHSMFYLHFSQLALFTSFNLHHFQSITTVQAKLNHIQENLHLKMWLSGFGMCLPLFWSVLEKQFPIKSLKTLSLENCQHW